jgi:serine kinase of HPr protein (carbohydrate metabolism regulator)
VAGIIVHGTCVAIGGRGVLLVGSPGSGKSDLALRLIDAPGRAVGENVMDAVLVSDDQTQVVKQGNRLIASAPPQLAGLLEVRGLGIVKCRHMASCDLALAVRLAPFAQIERMPDPKFATYEVAQSALPLVAVDPASPAAPARVRAALLSLSQS